MPQRKVLWILGVLWKIGGRNAIQNEDLCCSAAPDGGAAQDHWVGLFALASHSARRLVRMPLKGQIPQAGDFHRGRRLAFWEQARRGCGVFFY